ncbi:MAG: bifunctional oligoribonuclease/PAP phosphatase NrnA [Streptococcaceae bacterium]|nr:bifunctional oligoribonuclease/PAP phosphatase NrnA [Streptococcaceae bacterium]
MNEILEKIKQYETIVIFRHMKPDPDALGSQGGLRAILRENFPEKKVYAVGFDEPTLSYLVKMDTAREDVPSEFLGIACDTANTPRMDGFELFQQATETLKIDHHPNNDAYGDVQWVEPARSSTSEMICDWAFQEKLRVSTTAARLLYAGIVGDTGRFLFPSTSAKTLALAAELATYDFDRAELGREMNAMELKVARLQGFIYESLEISAKGAARVFLTQEIMTRFQVTDAETSMIVSAPGVIREVKSWAIFVEQNDGHFRVRMRSKTVPIEPIARRHDGGGHALASGANAYSMEEAEEIWEELKANLENNS